MHGDIKIRKIRSKMLKSFHDFVKLKENQDDYGDNEVLYNVVDIAWQMNRPKLFGILKDIAQEDENSKLNNMLNILQKQMTNDLNKLSSSPAPNKEDNQIAPPVADTNQGIERFQ